MMGTAKIDNRISADEIVPGQVRADVIQINHVVRNNALGVELNENQVAHAKVGAEDRQLAVGDSLFQFDLTDGLERSADFIGRIRHPTIRQLRSVE